MTSRYRLFSLSLPVWVAITQATAILLALTSGLDATAALKLACRFSARVSALWFLLAYVLPSVEAPKLTRGPRPEHATLAFGCAHLIHLTVVSYYLFASGTQLTLPSLLTLGPGTLGWLLMFWSSTRSSRLGPGIARTAIERIAQHVVWITFLGGFVKHLSNGGLVYTLLLAAFVFALAWRLWRLRSNRQSQ